MKKHSKRFKQIESLTDKSKIYALKEAVAVIKKAIPVKFNESIELNLHLNIDPKKSEELVRGTVVLPHGTGKKKKIAVFCKGEQESLASSLGVDFVGGSDLIEKVASGFLDFDCAIATPEMMKDLSRLGKILGPRGLMPSPKTGTVTNDIAHAIKEVKAGKIEFKSDKQGGLHVAVGKLSFSEQQIYDNAECVLEAIKQVKPASVKGELFKSISLATTMGVGLKVSI
ncbi:MAG: 50S ribosomal protein L1 [Candidatus Omnitrophota bacterium]|nr:50S ribosomal protein L1 [Candidatus Omnitrophota bacterium]